MEALDDEYLLHDFVVIFRLVLKLLKFSDIFELFDQIVSEAMPDHLCELLEVHEDEDLGETEESKHINQGCIFWLQDTLHGTDQWPSKDSQQVKDESASHVVHHNLEDGGCEAVYLYLLVPTLRHPAAEISILFLNIIYLNYTETLPT